MSSPTENMTVSTRLALGFGATVALGVCIVAYAAVTMNGLSKDINELASNRMVKVAQLNDVKDNLQTIGRRVRNIIIIDNDPVKYEAERADIAKLRATNTELLSKLDKSITLPKGRELFKVITETRQPYNEALDRALNFALKNENAKASAVLFDEVLPLQTTLFKAVDGSRDLQNEIANTLVKHAEATAAFSVQLMGGLALLMAAIGGAVGFALSRGLRKALGAEPTALSEAVARVADGDLSQHLQVDPGDTTSVLANVARMQVNLSSVVANVRSNSESVATASSQISQGNTDLSQRTEQQASALQQTAATMEQLGATVRTNADSARQANQMAQGASVAATEGGEVVGRVVATMQGINDSSRKISDIIGVIDGIAFQTNILALNAAVEAARAGEQGRGFAVVASEVRNLAQRSAEAAKEIKALIGRSVEQVEQGTALVDDAGRSMNDLIVSIQKVADIVGEISSASVEQSSGVQQVGQAVSQMDQVTQQNAALVEESAAAAESLKNQALQLVQAVAVFKLSTQGGQAVSASAAKAFHTPVQAHKATVVRPQVQPSAVKRVAPPAPKAKTVSAALPAPTAALATSEPASDNWETF